MRNRLPSLNGISEIMSPLTILTGLPNPSYSSFKLEFGQYVQVHNHPQRTNNMEARSTPAIALKPSSSENGWYFTSLDTGKRILQYKWIVLPIPTNVIEQTHELADKYKLKNKKTNVPLSDKQSDDESTTKDSNTQYDPQSQKSISTDGSNSNNRYEIIQDEESSQNVDDLSSKFVADSMSDLSISQRSTKNKNKLFADIFENSSLDDVDQMESLASINEYNEFHDTEEYSNEIVSVSENINDNKDHEFPFNDYREIDEDSSKLTDNDYSPQYQTTFEKKRSELNNAFEGPDIHTDNNTEDGLFGDSDDNVSETKDD